MRLLHWLRERVLWIWPYDHRQYCDETCRGRECVLDPREHTYQHQGEDGFRWAA